MLLLLVSVLLHFYVSIVGCRFLIFFLDASLFLPSPELSHLSLPFFWQQRSLWKRYE